MASLSDGRPTHLGLDVHKDSISIGILHPDANAPVIERIFNDDAAIRGVIDRFPSRSDLRVCYEAGPTGYDLHRLLTAIGVRCDVVAPSLIPRAPGDRVKTDRRDCRRLALLHRAGQLVPIRVPALAEEAVRDLCRARDDMVIDRTRAQHRLNKFLLRHGRIFRDGRSWTAKHQEWIRGQRFDEPALRVTFEHYLAVFEVRDAAVRAIEADLIPWTTQPPLGDQVNRLAAYRGVTALGALTLASEVCDWRRFARPTQFMGFCGLVPSEYSSGSSTRRGHITKAGNPHLRHQLVESAWAYQHRPSVNRAIALRQQHATAETVARAWRAQLRLSGKFRRLSSRKHSRNVVITAVARELAGFLWAEMNA